MKGWPRAVSKYRNKPAMRGTLRFASQAEARRYDELMLLVAAGEIRDIRLQPRYRLEVNGEHIATYVADFEYHQHVVTFQDGETGWRKIIEDVKGFRTDAYRLKAKLMHALYGITIREVQMGPSKPGKARGGMRLRTQSAAMGGADAR